MHLDLRLRSLRHLEECGDFPGYGIGGYSVGEDHETMFETPRRWLPSTCPSTSRAT